MYDNFVYSFIFGIDGLYINLIVIVICLIDVLRKLIECYLGCSGVWYFFMYEGYVFFSIIYLDVEMLYFVEILG